MTEHMRRGRRRSAASIFAFIHQITPPPLPHRDPTPRPQTLLTCSCSWNHLSSLWQIPGDELLIKQTKRGGGGGAAHPSSRYTSAMVWKQVRYLISPGTGWGPWMRLLATSKGMLTQEEMVPDTRPMVNFLRNSRVGSWSKRRLIKEVLWTQI